MSFLNSLREKNRVISAIVKFQNSVFFPILFAIVCIISGVSGKAVYVPCIIFLTVLCVFGGLFSKDLKVFLVPFMMFYYAIGFDAPEKYYAYYEKPILVFKDIALLPLLICGGLIIATLFFRLIADGHIKEMFTKRGLFFWGIICFDAALLLSGIFTSVWDWRNLVFAAIIAFFLTFCYLLFTVLIAHSKDAVGFLCKIMVCLGFVAFFQIATIATRLAINDNLIVYNGFLNRDMLSLSWGYSTIVGAIFVPAIAAALYLMRTRKFPVLSFLSACIFLITVFAINTRSALFVGSAIFLAGVIFACVGKKNKNKKTNIIASLSLLGAGVLAVGIICIVNFSTLSTFFEKFLNFFRFDIDDGNLNEFFSGRFSYWSAGIDNFLSAPIFGKGFIPAAAAGKDFFGTMFCTFQNMNHCIFIQLLGSMGIVGVLAFIIHARIIVEVGVRRPTLDRLFLLFVPIGIIVMSFADNFFFIPNFIMIYAAFIAAAEIDLEHKRKEILDNVKAPRKEGKPRVVFAYVEAGKGHITATQNVYDVFVKKYGHKVDVIQSRFFSETNDPDMMETERMFSQAVMDQNRSPIFSVLAKAGNLLGGDTFALYALLKLGPSGVRTFKPAVKHIDEIDADIIYTAHWSVPFYANHLKTPRPYVIDFCPDVYSNGAFNVDCNEFIIATEGGYKQLQRFRMYAGGNLTYIPYPFRPGTDEYRKPEKKLECRQALGISKDEFVVVLCDGGYGMAKLEKTVKLLLKSKEKMTLIALCGTNHELYLRLMDKLPEVPSHIKLIPVDFTTKMLDYLACADLFVGKGGANAITEPASLGVPVIITRCITYIEKGTKNYFSHHVKGAMYIPSAHLAARKVRKFINNPSLLDKYHKNLAIYNSQKNDPDGFADLLWKRVCEMYGYDENDY